MLHNAPPLAPTACLRQHLNGSLISCSMLSIRTYARAGLQSQRAPFPGDTLRTRISADNHGEAGGLASLHGHGVHGGMQTQHLRSTCKSQKKKNREKG